MWLLVLLICFRTWNAFSIKTFFQPDEYWQSLEPAHFAVYGYGYQTWEWKEHLRSAAHPLLYAAIYKLAQWFSLDVVTAPKIFQGITAGIGDYYTYKLAQRLVSPEAAQWTLLASVGSAFNWFCLTRTFANSLETILTAVALAYWPWDLRRITMVSYMTSLATASLACICRPTNGLLWVVLAAHLVFKTRSLKIFVIGVLILALSLSINFVIDWTYFGQPVFPPAKFVLFNVVQSLSHFYGVSPWHYYLSQGLPLLLIGYLPLGIYELWASRHALIVGLIAVVVCAYSLLAHKEVRFIFPLLPLLHVLVGKCICRFSIKGWLMAALIAINVPVALYASLYHQRGVIDVMDYLRHDPAVTSVGFLMPCHSTPWQSHLHRPDVDAWFLTCEPPIDVPLEGYLDEADQFYANPVAFLDKHFPADRQWPSHLVFFEVLEPTLIQYLDESYEECARFFNSHFHDDWRRVGDVVVYRQARM
jgi:phosphatidylinositol glycan class B